MVLSRAVRTRDLQHIGPVVLEGQIERRLRTRYLARVAKVGVNDQARGEHVAHAQADVLHPALRCARLAAVIRSATSIPF